MGAEDLLDAHQSLLDPTSVFLCRPDISNLILKRCLRNWNTRTHQTEVLFKFTNFFKKHQRPRAYIFYFKTARSAVTTELDSDQGLQNL